MQEPGTPWIVSEHMTVTANGTLIRTGQKQRKKSFAPKVRSGCITCRKRRVKCDERQPGCRRCSRGGFLCLGYEADRTWVFEPSTAQSATEDAEKGWKTTIDHSTLRLLSFRQRSCSPGAPISAPLAFENTTEAWSCQFFIHNTGPLVSQFATAPQQLLGAIMSSACQCTASKLLLIALGMTDKCLWGGEQEMVSYQTATRYYNAAIGLMAREQYSLSNVLIASLLAAVFDTSHRRAACGRLHLDSAIKIIESCLVQSDSARSGSQPEECVITIIKPALTGYQKLHDSMSVFVQGASLPGSGVIAAPLTLPTGFSSLAHAAGVLEPCMDLLCQGYLSAADAAAFGKSWLDLVRRYRAKTPDLSLQRWSLYLAYATLGTSLEVIGGQLMGSEAEARWNYISNQIEKAAVPPALVGFADVLTVIIKAMTRYCSQSQPLERAERVMRTLQNQ